MSKQVRIRRDTRANIKSVVPANSELAHDTDNERIHIGDGATSGGIDIPNYRDIQNNTYTTGTIGGTANAITLTVLEAPQPYAVGQKFLIRPTANNTGAVTININGLGAQNIQKNNAGTFVALAANDLRSGVWYEITYDGTRFQLAGGGGGAGIASTNIVTFTASGTYTAPANLVNAIVEVVGGGGGSGGFGANGGTGGTTSFGSLLSATGGAFTAARDGNAKQGGAGGVGSTGDYNATGGAGEHYFPTTSPGVSGKGGDSFFGGGARSVVGSDAGGLSAPANSGGGGSGCLVGGTQGSSGGGGGGYARRRLTAAQIGTSQTVTVGAGGTAGGGGPPNGGAGGSGIVIITEFLSA